MSNSEDTPEAARTPGGGAPAVALVGCGRMGSLLAEVAAERGWRVAERFTSARPLPAEPDDATRRRLAGVSAAIDFSTADAVPATARAAARLGLPLVVGTTGWSDRLDEVRAAVEEHGGALVWGANFSLGVHLLYRLVDRAAELFAPLAGYDPFVEEAHHKGKRDSPSGTARELTRRLGERYGDRPLPVASLRAGHIPGTHRVGFDSAADTVVIEHRARSRRGFAEGALVAARWIAGRRGMFEFGTVLDDLLSIRGGT
jgi:4-hydroxy-tetrahydrodipicolinate reductase